VLHKTPNPVSLEPGAAQIPYRNIVWNSPSRSTRNGPSFIAVSPNPDYQLKYGSDVGAGIREVTDLVARNRAGYHHLVGHLFVPRVELWHAKWRKILDVARDQREVFERGRPKEAVHNGQCNAALGSAPSGRPSAQQPHDRSAGPARRSVPADRWRARRPALRVGGHCPSKQCHAEVQRSKRH
jgi:hypothetical protein